MTDVVAERGYEATTVDAVLDRAGVARSEFDERFAGKEDCALKTLEAFIADFEWKVGGAYAAFGDWRTGLRAAAYACADWLVEVPNLVRFGLVEVMKADSDMPRVRREEAFRFCAALIDGGRAEAVEPVGESTAVVAIGSIIQLLTQRMQIGAAVSAHEIVPQMMYAVVRPYLGEEAAREELTMPRPGVAGPDGLPMVTSKTMSEPGTEAEGLPRLPPGRHGLPREFVVKNQRDRLAAGVIAAVAEYGYHGMTVTGIAAAAGVSRRTFYGYFPSKVECFLDTYEAVARHLTEVVSGAGSGVAEWPDRVRAELRALLETLAANPDLVNFCLVAPQSAGGEAVAAYRSLLDSLLAELTAGAPQPAGRPVSESGRQSLVGGISALLVARADAGEGEALPSLLADLQELVLGPYLGREAAARIARSSG